MFLKKVLPEESSIADIAFLLLIFFLVTATINVDTGITLIFSPLNKDQKKSSKIEYLREYQ